MTIPKILAVISFLLSISYSYGQLNQADVKEMMLEINTESQKFLAIVREENGSEKVRQNFTIEGTELIYKEKNLLIKPNVKSQKRAMIVVYDKIKCIVGEYPDKITFIYLIE